MSRRYSVKVFASLAAVLMAFCVLNVLPAWAQHGSTGTVSVTVLDPTGSVVQGAQLLLIDSGTNSAIKAETQNAGTYSFVNLSLGTYKLSISKSGFKTQKFDSVVVESTKTTDVKVTLSVGTTDEVVTVTASEVPLVETTSSAISSVINLKQIENLPITGRDLTAMTQLVPGYTGTLKDGGGTWNGLPSIAQGSNIDGVVGNAGRMKFGGAAEPAVQPRIENIQEMTVQTDQLDMNQGFGNSSMQINFVTRRGTNQYHGRLYEDFRNSALNANSWTNGLNGTEKNHLILNEFGGSLGGPIVRDKLFFFGTFAMSKQPGKTDQAVWVLTPAAQAGTFTYGNGQTVNVLQLAANCTSTCNNTALPTTLNAQTQSTLSAVNGVLSDGVISNDTGDPNFQNLRWQVDNPDKHYFPAVRVDFNPDQKTRFNIAWNYTKRIQPGSNPVDLPGEAFADTGAGDQFKSYTAALGFNRVLTPTLVNEFRGGFLYTASFFAYNGHNPDKDTQQIGWNFANLPFPYNTQMNATNFKIPTGSYYPVFTASDTLSWQKGAHTMNFGFSWWREQNHYYNGVLGFPSVNLGLATGDPAIGAFSASTLPGGSGNDISEARELYAVLTGRISGITGSYAYDKSLNAYKPDIGTYNLDELQKAWGLFFQDSYRIRPNLTLNYGLRWDFTWPDYDLTKAYHSAATEAVWGPSGENNIFSPGTLTGTDPILTQNSSPAKPWFVTPQPSLGIAWNPHSDNGAFGKLLGGDKTVIRAGFSLRRFTEPQQYFWNQASDYGAFYFQSFFLNANNTGQTGTYAPGSLALGDAFGSSASHPYGVAPAAYLETEPVSDFTFLGGPGVNGVERNIRQPYTQSWNLGIQRQLGPNRALEVRYIGNRSLRQWIVLNQNEINVFENGFLNEFKNAQANMQINAANGFDGTANPRSFANLGFAGQHALPIFDAAFAGESSGAGGLADFTDGGPFADWVNFGQVGLAANALAGIGGPVSYFCNLVGEGFGPCANNAGFSGPGAGYPINFFQVNPYAQGVGLSQLAAKGYSNYNALQVDFRQQQWHGLQFDANYTWSHTLGIATQNNWQGATNLFTLRDMHLAYGPTLFDIRHSMHVSGTYDLPFGKGKSYANKGGVVDKIVGGWSVGTIFTFQTGNPFPLQGGYNTFNDYADGGVVLHGVTASQLQDAIGVHHLSNTDTRVSFIDPKYLKTSTGSGANPAFITPNTTPGTIGQIIYLHGPHYINDDLSITKHVAIRENVSFSLQAAMLNAFNHVSFQPGSGSGCAYGCYAAGGGFPNIQASGFGIGGTSPSYAPRLIELRANLEF
jgi:hypothetical protein